MTPAEMKRTELLRMVGQLQQLLLRDEVAEVYLQAVVTDTGKNITVLCTDSGTTRYGRQVLETLHGYLRNKGRG